MYLIFIQWATSQLPPITALKRLPSAKILCQVGKWFTLMHYFLLSIILMRPFNCGEDTLLLIRLATSSRARTAYIHDLLFDALFHLLKQYLLLAATAWSAGVRVGTNFQARLFDTWQGREPTLHHSNTWCVVSKCLRRSVIFQPPGAQMTRKFLRLAIVTAASCAYFCAVVNLQLRPILFMALNDTGKGGANTKQKGLSHHNKISQLHRSQQTFRLFGQGLFENIKLRAFKKCQRLLCSNKIGPTPTSLSRKVGLYNLVSKLLFNSF